MTDDTPQVEPIVVAGRTFRPATNTTFEQDLFIMERVDATGADSLELKGENDLTAFAQKTILDAYRSGKLFELVAGMLVEDGKEWSPEAAKVNALFFAGLRDKADKEALHESMVAALLSFFLNAVSSFSTSPNSLEGASESGEPSRTPPLPPKRKLTGGRKISSSGTKSSGKSPATTLKDFETL